MSPVCCRRGPVSEPGAPVLPCRSENAFLGRFLIFPPVTRGIFWVCPLIYISLSLHGNSSAMPCSRHHGCKQVLSLLLKLEVSLRRAVFRSLASPALGGCQAALWGLGGIDWVSGFHRERTALSLSPALASSNPLHVTVWKCPRLPPTP